VGRAPAGRYVGRKFKAQEQKPQRGDMLLTDYQHIAPTELLFS
jgi:hypothetical protein